MIYIETNQKKEVVLRHFMPFDETYGLGKTEQELLQTGFLVESIPEPNQSQGEIAILKFNDGQLYYDYENAPANEIEELRLEMARNNAELFETMIMLTGGM